MNPQVLLPVERFGDRRGEMLRRMGAVRMPHDLLYAQEWCGAIDVADAADGSPPLMASDAIRLVGWLRAARMAAAKPRSQSPRHETVTNDNSRRIFRPARPWIESRCGVRTDDRWSYELESRRRNSSNSTSSSENLEVELVRYLCRLGPVARVFQDADDRTRAKDAD